MNGLSGFEHEHFTANNMEWTMEGSESKTPESYHDWDRSKYFRMPDTATQLGWYNKNKVNINKTSIINIPSPQTFPYSPVANTHYNEGFLWEVDYMEHMLASEHAILFDMLYPLQMNVTEMLTSWLTFLWLLKGKKKLCNRTRNVFFWLLKKSCY